MSSAADSFVVFNGRIMLSTQVQVSPLAAGLQFGQGVYTTMRVREGRLQFFNEHLTRLSNDAKVLGLPSVSLGTSLLDRCLACLQENGVRDGAMKVLWFMDLQGCSELIQLRTPSPLLAVKDRGVRLATVRGAVAGATVARSKTTSYAAHLLARREAVSKGFDEALWVSTDGAVLECSGANVFAVLNGAVQTPPVSAGLLPGVIRELILKGYPGARAASMSLTALTGAEEVFITNSLIGILPVASVDGRVFDPAKRTVTKLVTEYLEGLL